MAVPLRPPPPPPLHVGPRQLTPCNLLCSRRFSRSIERLFCSVRVPVVRGAPLRLRCGSRRWGSTRKEDLIFRSRARCEHATHPGQVRGCYRATGPVGTASAGGGGGVEHGGYLSSPVILQAELLVRFERRSRARHGGARQPTLLPRSPPGPAARACAARRDLHIPVHPLAGGGTLQQLLEDEVGNTDRREPYLGIGQGSYSSRHERTENLENH
eukprot:COSAG01_NODE_4779_length_4745_cov_14.712043_2_plen_214_part_00